MLKRKKHINTGLNNAHLNDCPDMPNCVTSEYPEDKKHYEEPWIYGVTHEELREELLKVLNSFSNSELVTAEDEYLHFTFTIPVFKYVDDVEFRLPKNEKKVHFRAASRVGYSDLGVNRRRLGKIRTELEGSINP